MHLWWSETVKQVSQQDPGAGLTVSSRPEFFLKEAYRFLFFFQGQLVKIPIRKVLANLQIILVRQRNALDVD
jgi:hypothetical protein